MIAVTLAVLLGAAAPEQPPVQGRDVVVRLTHRDQPLRARPTTATWHPGATDALAVRLGTTGTDGRLTVALERTGMLAIDHADGRSVLAVAPATHQGGLLVLLIALGLPLGASVGAGRVGPPRRRPA